MGKAPGWGDGDAIFKGAVMPPSPSLGSGSKEITTVSLWYVALSKAVIPSKHMTEKDGRKEEKGKENKWRKKERKLFLGDARKCGYFLSRASAQPQHTQCVYFIRGKPTTQIAC